MEKYLLHGKLLAKAGQRTALADILLAAAAILEAQAEGCRLYAIGQAADEPDAVYITEIWDSQAEHDASLQLPEVRALIGQAMPLLAEMPTGGQSLKVLGGVGV